METENSYALWRENKLIFRVQFFIDNCINEGTEVKTEIELFTLYRRYDVWLASQRGRPAPKQV